MLRNLILPATDVGRASSVLRLSRTPLVHYICIESNPDREEQETDVSDIAEIEDTSRSLV